MSKNITIQEGGQDKQLTVDKLKTSLSGGGTCLWVPEADTQLGTKTITQNGTYNAADDGYYGYSRVTVRGIGTATGTDSDGDTAIVTADPTTGRLVAEKIPSRIEVVTPPDNAYGVYQDGQVIDTAGMVVKAYLASGEEYGTVPIGEVTLEPAAADFSKTSGDRLTEDARFGQGYWPQPIRAVIGEATTNWNGDMRYEVYTVDGYIAFRTSRDDGTINGGFMCSAKPNTMGIRFFRGQPIEYPLDSSYTYDGKTAYYCSIGAASYAWPNVAINQDVTPTDGGLSVGQAAWITLYGTVLQSPNGQTITVKWPRPGDGEVLETTFGIQVAPGYGGEAET